LNTIQGLGQTVTVGGDEDALDRARSALDRFAKSIFVLGDIGAGATMKLVVDSLVHSLNVAPEWIRGRRAGSSSPRQSAQEWRSATLASSQSSLSR
jgi:hypothetical protein